MIAKQKGFVSFLVSASRTKLTIYLFSGELHAVSENCSMRAQMGKDGANAKRYCWNSTTVLIRAVSALHSNKQERNNVDITRRACLHPSCYQQSLLSNSPEPSSCTFVVSLRASRKL